jgi:hypothetical protein
VHAHRHKLEISADMRRVAVAAAACAAVCCVQLPEQTKAYLAEVGW